MAGRQFNLPALMFGVAVALPGIRMAPAPVHRKARPSGMAWTATPPMFTIKRCDQIAP